MCCPQIWQKSAQGCHIVPQIMRNALVVDARQNQICLTSDQCHIVYGHSVSGAVAKFAESRRARFITMGIQVGGAAVSHLPAGVTSSVIALAPCPVLLLASHGQDVSPKNSSQNDFEVVSASGSHTSSQVSHPRHISVGPNQHGDGSSDRPECRKLPRIIEAAGLSETGEAPAEHPCNRVRPAAVRGRWPGRDGPCILSPR